MNTRRLAVVAGISSSIAGDHHKITTKSRFIITKSSHYRRQQARRISIQPPGFMPTLFKRLHRNPKNLGHNLRPRILPANSFDQRR